jgi:hypothetical protein
MPRDGTLAGGWCQAKVVVPQSNLHVRYKYWRRQSGVRCWGFRLRDLSGNPSSTISAVDGLGPVYVTIEPSDAAFKTSHCQTWQKVG